MGSLRESEIVEFKKSTAEIKEAVISIAAMLNKHGRAEVYFGVADDGAVIGQTVGRKTLRDVTQIIVDTIEPKIFPQVELRKIEGKDCIVVKAEGIHSPYFAYGRVYIRVGESNKALSVHEIEKRILNKKQLLWESEFSKKTQSDVNEETVKDFMRKAKIAQRIDFDFVDVKTVLHKLHLLDGKQLTQAAEVLFCDDNRMEIQAAIFAGTDKLTFLDMKQFKGNLFALRQQAETYISEHMRWRADLSESRRKDIPEIPVRAISEAIGNSLCHRDFSNPKGNEVAIYKDRIEIYNPGFFPEELEPEDFFSGEEHSILRNPLIAEVMYKSRDIERWGSGIKRIHDECNTAGVKVEFKRLKTGFAVVFHRPQWEKVVRKGGQKRWSEKVVRKGGQKLTAKQSVLIDLLKENPACSRKDLAEKLSVNESAVQKRLDTLRNRGLIRRVGPDKGGLWEVQRVK